MICRPAAIMVAAAVLLILGSPKSQSQVVRPQCPVTIITPGTPSAGGFFPGPPPPALVATMFNFTYTRWSERVSRPDVAVSSDTEAWKRVPEFQDLIRPKKLFLPFILDRLRAGDFRLVPAIECITGIDSVRLYPTPMPQVGTFGLQDVAALWVANCNRTGGPNGACGGQVVEDECRAQCAAGDTACEQKCSDERQQYWGP